LTGIIRRQADVIGALYASMAQLNAVTSLERDIAAVQEDARGVYDGYGLELGLETPDGE
jgi:hypothetical protein